MQMRALNHEKKAFTLIELLLVIIIIGILAGMLVTNLSGKSEQARVARAESDIRSQLSTALDMFEQDVGRYPTTEEGLAALVEPGDIPNWKGPYLKGGLKPDPWGTAYIYAFQPDPNRKYDLRSAGPDRQAGTADDITE